MSETENLKILRLKEELIEVGREFYRRGWVLGTSGNFSAVVGDAPLRLLITASGMDKGQLTEDRFVVADENAGVVEGTGKPSDETKLHLCLATKRNAKSILHTHSVWGTLLSDAHAADGGLEIKGWEMLKGLTGVRSHDHREWIPILENSQDMGRLAQELAVVLEQQPEIHGFLLRGHGLYTWGQSVAEARRQIEIFEFLFEVMGRIRYSKQT